MVALMGSLISLMTRTAFLYGLTQKGQCEQEEHYLTVRR